MTRIGTGVFACLTMLLAASCRPQADTRAAEELVIRDLDEQWSKAASARDLEKTVSFYSDDAALLAPNAPMASGKQAVRASWAALLVPGLTVSWQVTKVDVARSGDLAYLIGTYVVAMKDAQGKPADDHGKLLEVWKKQADGSWKVAADIYNSDLPAAAPEAKK